MTQKFLWKFKYFWSTWTSKWEKKTLGIPDSVIWYEYSGRLEKGISNAYTKDRKKSNRETKMRKTRKAINKKKKENEMPEWRRIGVMLEFDTQKGSQFTSLYYWAEWAWRWDVSSIAIAHIFS